MNAGSAHLYTEAIRLGEVRGYLRGVDGLRNGVFDSEAPSSSFSVSKVLYNQRKPISSSTPVSSGNLVDELREWYARSEQIPALVHTEIRCEAENGT